MKNEVVNVTENYRKEMKLHREDTDQVMMKLLKQIKDLQTLNVGGSGGSLGGDIKQGTLVNILVRIELMEQEIRSLKNQNAGGALTERAGRGLNRANSLREFEESRV